MGVEAAGRKRENRVRQMLRGKLTVIDQTLTPLMFIEFRDVGR